MISLVQLLDGQTRTRLLSGYYFMDDYYTVTTSQTRNDNAQASG